MSNLTYCKCEIGACQGSDIERCANRTVPALKEIERLRRVESKYNETFKRALDAWHAKHGLDTVMENLLISLKEENIRLQQENMEMRNYGADKVFQVSEIKRLTQKIGDLEAELHRVKWCCDNGVDYDN